MFNVCRRMKCILSIIEALIKKKGCVFRLVPEHSKDRHFLCRHSRCNNVLDTMKKHPQDLTKESHVFAVIDITQPLILSQLHIYICIYIIVSIPCCNNRNNFSLVKIISEMKNGSLLPLHHGMFFCFYFFWVHP